MRVTYCDPAINWIWYGVIDIDIEAGTAEFDKDASYRLHRYDPNQGADKHPTVDVDLNGVYNGGGGPHKGYEAVGITFRETRESHILSIMSRPIWTRELAWSMDSLFTLLRWMHDPKLKRGNLNGVEVDLEALRKEHMIDA